jgi:hypothetical protein
MNPEGSDCARACELTDKTSAVTKMADAALRSEAMRFVDFIVESVCRGSRTGSYTVTGANQRRCVLQWLRTRSSTNHC